MSSTYKCKCSDREFDYDGYKRHLGWSRKFNKSLCFEPKIRISNDERIHADMDDVEMEPDVELNYNQLIAEQINIENNEFPIGHPDREDNTYVEMQKNMYMEIFGRDCIPQINLSDFKAAIRNMRLNEKIDLLLYQFIEKNHLSAESSDDLIQLVPMIVEMFDVLQSNIKMNFPSSWRSLSNRMNNKNDVKLYDSDVIPYHDEWQMNRWNGKKPSDIVIR